MAGIFIIFWDWSRRRVVIDFLSEGVAEVEVEYYLSGSDAIEEWDSESLLMFQFNVIAMEKKNAINDFPLSLPLEL